MQYGNKDIVNKWLSYYADCPSLNHLHDQHGLTPVHYAAKFNQLEIMKILCDFGKAGTIVFCPHSTQYTCTATELFNYCWVFGCE